MIKLIPIGGLCDRLATIECFLFYQRILDLKEIELVWYLNKDLNCKFDDIFDPIPNICVRNRKEIPIFNHKLFRLIKKGIFFLKRTTVIDLYQISDNDIEKLLKNKEKKIFKGFIFNDKRTERYFKMFNVREYILNMIPNINTHNTIGIHIRRTDNVIAIKNSPSDLFYEKIRLEIEMNPSVIFYCASDSDYEINKLIELFPDNIIYQEKCIRSRNNKEGMISATIDLFSLSQCSKIIGSDWSAFTWLASKINDIPLERIKLKC